MSAICCKFCSSTEYVKNGIIYNKQRYKCLRGIRIIERILGVSNVLVLHWLNNCGTIVENEVKKIKKESKKIPILEMDELYTYVKKKNEKSEFGLLLTETEMKLLHLK